MKITNIITIQKDGPLKIEGNFRLYNTMGQLLEHEGAMMLCRCGASKTKPFCDGSHTAAGFKDCCIIDNNKAEPLEGNTSLIISCRPNGMLVAKGPMLIIAPDAQSKITRNKAALCRCGASRNKPFCDVSHKKCGFIDDALQQEQTLTDESKLPANPDRTDSQ